MLGNSAHTLDRLHEKWQVRGSGKLSSFTRAYNIVCVLGLEGSHNQQHYWEYVSMAHCRGQIWPIDLLLYKKPQEVFAFLNSWAKEKEEEYFMKCGDYMKFKFQCPQIKLCWNFALLVSMVAFKLQWQSWEAATRDFVALKLKVVIISPFPGNVSSPMVWKSGKVSGPQPSCCPGRMMDNLVDAWWLYSMLSSPMHNTNT